LLLPIREDVMLECRQKFDCRKRKCTLPYDEILELFRDTELTPLDIAGRLGISREGVRLMFASHFEPVLGVSMRARRAVHTDERRRRMTQLPERFARVALIAQNAGLTLEPATNTTPYRVSETRAVIGGRMCLMRRCGRAGQTSDRNKRWYYRVHVALPVPPECDVLFVHAYDARWPERVFIIPVAVVRALAGERSRPLMLYLPTELLPPYNNSHQQVDWWKYENAWHLLAGNEQQTA
jgi:hypothetical protein